jgi:hypothetical protein
MGQESSGEPGLGLASSRLPVVPADVHTAGTPILHLFLQLGRT